MHKVDIDKCQHKIMITCFVVKRSMFSMITYFNDFMLNGVDWGRREGEWGKHAPDSLLFYTECLLQISNRCFEVVDGCGVPAFGKGGGGPYDSFAIL